MSSLIPFSFESHSVRAFNINGAPWFVGKDVAEALGYKDPTTAIRSHCKGVLKLHPLTTAGGTQDVRVINEPDTFRLIVGSNLPEAERFERWLFEEVLPTIRQTGGYALPGAQPATDPATLAQQLADLLNGKVAVDRTEWTTVRQGIDALREAFGWLDQRAEAIERTAVRFPVAACKSSAHQQPAVHDFQNARQKVLDFIAARKKQGAGARHIHQFCKSYRNLPDDKRKELIRQLLSAGEIVEVFTESQPGARRKAVIYVAKAFAGVAQ